MARIDSKHRYIDIELSNIISERKLEKLFFENLEEMMKSLFGEEVIESCRQYSKSAGIIKINKGQFIAKRGKRIDIYAKCKSGNNYLIEIKVIGNTGETFRAIGQLLFYSMYFPEANKMILVSNKYEPYWGEVVKRYNLPVEFVLIGKKGTFLLQK